MGLHQLCTQIEQSAKLRAASILKEAKADARRIESAAQKTADDSIALAKAQALEFCQSESKERINAARLEASKILSEAKDEAVRQSLAQVWEKYSQLPSKPEYKEKLRQWANTALEDLGLSGAVLRSSQKDRAILSSMGFKVGDSINCVGGVRAESKDGKIMADYTLESMFESKKEEIAREIYASLFQNEPDLEEAPQTGGKKIQKRGN